MRIAIVNWNSQPVGGVGSYLRLVIPALGERGHDVAFWHEQGNPPDGNPFALPSASPSWSVQQIGQTLALKELAAWRPDVIANHGLLDPSLETRTLAVAPAVLHLHGYYGTCISGAKTFKFPTTTPCSRRFGWPCLAEYYPRRCGGWSPITMLREFRRQSQRLALLCRYKALLVYSAHLQREFARHGLRTTCIGPPIEPAAASRDRTDHRIGFECRLLFVGRMDPLKGGRHLLDALPHVALAIGRPIHMTFAGDGPSRRAWEADAATVMARVPRLRVEFTGWLDRGRIGRLMQLADLLVVPSVWPEPFGLVGLEAARARLPVAAFAVGGIRDWLRPGVNGSLAPGDPPTPRGLAAAIVACVKDEETHARLREGAGRVAAETTFDNHVDALMRVLDDVAGGSVDESRTDMSHAHRPTAAR
jgi:glycosyltransferase involved in cell wall biosynthesis